MKNSNYTESWQTYSTLNIHIPSFNSCNLFSYWFYLRLSICLSVYLYRTISTISWHFISRCHWLQSSDLSTSKTVPTSFGFLWHGVLFLLFLFDHHVGDSHSVIGCQGTFGWQVGHANTSTGVWVETHTWTIKGVK